MVLYLYYVIGCCYNRIDQLGFLPCVVHVVCFVQSVDTCYGFEYYAFIEGRHHE
jgi:hypothetical protein